MDFRENPKGEVRRISLLGTSVNTPRTKPGIHREFIGVCDTGGKTEEEERWPISTPSFPLF
jgi:hypothetical protein